MKLLTLFSLSQCSQKQNVQASVDLGAGVIQTQLNQLPCAFEIQFGFCACHSAQNKPFALLRWGGWDHSCFSVTNATVIHPVTCNCEGYPFSFLSFPQNCEFSGEHLIQVLNCQKTHEPKSEPTGQVPSSFSFR